MGQGRARANSGFHGSLFNEARRFEPGELAAHRLCRRVLHAVFFAYVPEKARPSPARRTKEEMNKFSKDLVRSLREARDHAEGRAGSARVQVVEVPNVRAIQRTLHLSQQASPRNIAFLCRRCAIGSTGGGNLTHRRPLICIRLHCARVKSVKLLSSEKSLPFRVRHFVES